MEDNILIYKYKLTTINNINNSIIHSSVYSEDRLINAKKEYYHQVALYHNVDNTNVTIKLEDIDTSAIIESYDTETDNT